MTDPQVRAAKWLRASRQHETQEALAADIERVTGWRITRDRYSKYESGNLPMGAVVLGRFVDYWATRGVGGPEEAAESTERPGTVTDPGLSDLVTAIQSLVDELRLSRLSEPLSIEDQIAAAERSLDELRSRRLPLPADPPADGAAPRPSPSRGELVAAGGRKGTPA